MAQNNISVTIAQLDDDGQSLARRTFTVSDTDPNAGELRQGLLTDTSQKTISFTALYAQIRQLAFRNTHASAKITVVWTPNGGAEATTLIVGPGACILFWEPNTHAAEGISSLKLTSDVANATYELFIGG